ncbi:MAG: serine/threonine-protein kinase [Myxococcota bacterium]
MASDDPFGPPPGGPAIHADPLVGALLDGRYRIVESVGAGGVADVYRGETEGVRRKVAIKILQEDFGANENLRGRFDREARALAALSHPHIVTMIDYGITEGMPYLVMELLEGRTLGELLDDGPLPPERAFHITRQIVRALVFAHGQGLIHRDLKPGNVFLQDLPGDPDHVKILDFGFAKFLAGDEEGPVLTRTGMVFGTPPYMAPEQVSGTTIDGRADIYATAVMLFEMFAARRPFEGETQALLRSKLTEPAPRLAEIDPELVVQPALDALLARALARDPNDRHATAAEFGEALEAIPQPAVRRRGGWESLVGDSIGAAPAKPTPPATPPRETPGERPGSPKWLPLAIAAGAVGLLGLVVCAGGLTWWLLRDGGEPDLQPRTPAAAMAGEPEPADDDGTPAQATPKASDPWAGEVPEPIASIRDRWQAQQPISNADLRELRAYARDHADDPRPHLLSGHVYFERRWRSDALERYRLAHEVGPERARGDGRMLANLVVMAAAPAPLGPQAARALETIYADSAAPAIEAALDRPGLDDRQKARLRQVREDIAPGR